MKLLHALLILVLTASPVLSEGLKLGVFLPLSGPASSWGDDLRKILVFANKKLANDSYKLVFEDDRCDSKQAVSAAQKLISIDHVNFAIGLCSSSVFAAGPLFNQNKIALIAAATNAAEVSNLGPWVFRLGVSTEGAAEILFSHVSSLHKSVGILTEESAHASGLLRKFQAQAKKNQDIRLFEYAFLPDTFDFKPYLLKIKANEVPALVINTNDEAAFASIVKQIVQLRLKLKLYGAFLPGTSGTQSLLPKPSPDITFVDSPIFTGRAASLLDEFKQTNGALHSADYLVVLGFEAFRVLDQLAKSNQAADHYLRQTIFNGVFGPYRFADSGDVVGLHYSLKRLVAGQVQVLDASITTRSTRFAPTWLR
jgi:ABC-type branched-subunit amino acid transport system substrate-binding protein